MKKFLIIKQTSLGDILHSTVAINIIKTNFPESQITFMVDKSGLAIIKNNPKIDKIIEFDLKFLIKNFKKNPFKVLIYIIKKIKEIKNEKYDYAFDLQGLERSVLFLYFAKADNKFVKGKYPFLKGFKNKKLHATLEIAGVFKIAGFNIPELKMELYINKTSILNKKITRLIINELNLQKTNKFKINENKKKDKNENSNNHISNKIPKTYNHGNLSLEHITQTYNIILISPFTRWETKNWGLDNFFSFLDIINKNCIKNTDNKKEFLFIFTGTKDKIILINNMLSKNITFNFSFPVINLAGKLNLEEFIFLLSKSRLIITGDSFASHAANALNIPLIVLFGPTDEKRVGPLNKLNAFVIRDKNLKCQKCYKRKCPLKKNKMKCMNNIKPLTVYNYFLKIFN